MSNDKLFHYAAQVDRVVDGDTIDVILDLGFDIHLRARVRFAGINAPESRTRNPVEKQAGLAAKRLSLARLGSASLCSARLSSTHFSSARPSTSGLARLSPARLSLSQAPATPALLVEASHAGHGQPAAQRISCRRLAGAWARERVSE